MARLPVIVTLILGALASTSLAVVPVPPVPPATVALLYEASAQVAVPAAKAVLEYILPMLNDTIRDGAGKAVQMALNLAEQPLRAMVAFAADKMSTMLNRTLGVVHSTKTISSIATKHLIHTFDNADVRMWVSGISPNADTFRKYGEIMANAGLSGGTLAHMDTKVLSAQLEEEGIKSSLHRHVIIRALLDEQLLEAVGVGAVHRVRSLLAGGDVNVNAHYFHPVVGTLPTTLLVATAKGHQTIVELLLEHGADCGFHHLNGVTPVIAAVGLRRTELVSTLLKHPGCEYSVNEVSSSDSTFRGAGPLLIAVTNGDHAIMQLLLDARADVNARDPSGMDALTVAATRNDFIAASMLAKYGARCTGSFSAGTAILYAGHATVNGTVSDELAHLLLNLCHQSEITRYFLMLRAISSGNTSKLEDVLADPVAKQHINTVGATGGTPLVYACSMHTHNPDAQISTVRTLLAYGADVNLGVDNTAWACDTPLLCCVNVTRDASTAFKLASLLVAASGQCTDETLLNVRMRSSIAFGGDVAARLEREVDVCSRVDLPVQVEDCAQQPARCMPRQALPDHMQQELLAMALASRNDAEFFAILDARHDQCPPLNESNCFLHAVVRNGTVAMVERVLRCSAFVEREVNRLCPVNSSMLGIWTAAEVTPLHVALLRASPERVISDITRLLLEAKASAGMHMRRPASTFWKQDTLETSAVRIVAARGHADVMRVLLTDGAVTPDVLNEDNFYDRGSALCFAIARADVKMARLLIRRGASSTVPHCGFWTTLKKGPTQLWTTLTPGYCVKSLSEADSPAKLAGVFAHVHADAGSPNRSAYKALADVLVVDDGLMQAEVPVIP